MAATYHIDRAAGVVHIDWGDTLPSTGAFRSVLESIFTDAAFRPGMHFLSDRRRVPQVPDPSFSRYLVQYFQDNAARFGGCRWATVVSTDAAYGGMTRLTEVIKQAGGVDFRGFRDIFDAETWVTGRR